MGPASVFICMQIPNATNRGFSAELSERQARSPLCLQRTVCVKRPSSIEHRINYKEKEQDHGLQQKRTWSESDHRAEERPVHPYDRRHSSGEHASKSRTSKRDTAIAKSKVRIEDDQLEILDRDARPTRFSYDFAHRTRRGAAR